MSQKVDFLKNAALTVDEFWVRVHAIEFLIELGYLDEAKDAVERCRVFESESGKRVGIWRMLTRLSSGNERSGYISKISEVYTDVLADDRVFAAESLLKLGLFLPEINNQTLVDDISKGGALAVYTVWGNYIHLPNEVNKSHLMDYLEKGNDVERLVASFALQSIQMKDGNIKGRVEKRLILEDINSIAYPYMLVAAVVLGIPVANDKKVELATRNDKLAKMEYCKICLLENSSILKKYLDQIWNGEILIEENGEKRMESSANMDARISAAYTLLKLQLN